MFRSFKKPLAVASLVVGMSLGSYGIAAAASGSATTGTTTTPSTQSAPPGASSSNPRGQQRSDETTLTGDNITKVKESGVAKAGSDATIVRIETDGDGHAVYEAHMIEADGTAVTVYVDASYNVVSVESR